MHGNWSPEQGLGCAQPFTEHKHHPRAGLKTHSTVQTHSWISPRRWGVSDPAPEHELEMPILLRSPFKGREELWRNELTGHRSREVLVGAVQLWGLETVLKTQRPNFELCLTGKGPNLHIPPPRRGHSLPLTDTKQIEDTFRKKKIAAGEFKLCTLWTLDLILCFQDLDLWNPKVQSKPCILILLCWESQLQTGYNSVEVLGQEDLILTY